MGAAQRANAARIAAGGAPKGEPERPQLIARVLDAKKIDNALKTHDRVRFQLRTGTYEIDRRGVLRRVRPLPVSVARYGPSITPPKETAHGQ